MKRAVSYSDSFIYLNGNTQLEPLVISTWEQPTLIQNIQEEDEGGKEQEKKQEHEYPITKPGDIWVPWFDTCVFFVIKGSLHIFFISSFETIFYFLYVSKSEDGGIMNTINTYYMPLIQSCDTWSDKTREFLLYLLQNEINKSVIDAKGVYALEDREGHNNILLDWSIAYSGICLAVFTSMIGIVYWKKIVVPWWRLLLEHLAFVVLLGLYEYFFFRTIIYKYQTISTDELNQYLIDGAFQCLE